MQLLVLSIPLTKDAITSSLTIPPTYPFLSLSPPSPSLSRSWSLQMHLHDQTAETSCKLQAARLLWLSVTVTRCPGIMQKKRKIARLLRLLARGAAASRHRHWDRQIDRRIKTAHALCGCAAQWNESQANLLNPNKCVTFIGKSLKNCLQTHLTTGEGGWGDWNKQEQYIVPSSLHSKQSGLHLTAVNIVF